MLMLLEWTIIKITIVTSLVWKPEATRPVEAAAATPLLCAVAGPARHHHDKNHEEKDGRDYDDDDESLAATGPAWMAS